MTTLRSLSTPGLWILLAMALPATSTAEVAEPPQRIEPAYAWDATRPPRRHDDASLVEQFERAVAPATPPQAVAYSPQRSRPGPGAWEPGFETENSHEVASAVLQRDLRRDDRFVREAGYLPASHGGYDASTTYDWYWQLLPDGLIFHNYMAGVHESRISGVVFEDRTNTSYFDVTLGGRVGVLRLGTDGDQPEGWQVDLEGAAFPRLNLSENWDVDATDFRFGVPLTYGNRQWQTKFAYYHLSSHLGDELAIRDPTTLAARINYSRDALVWAISYFPHPAVRTYAEADWAFHFDDGNKPWEFQFGIDYAQPGRTGICGTPFVALNAHLREAVDFGGNLVVQAGWLWRGESGRTVRAGFHYYNGKSNQFEFFDRFEEQVGFGIWYDQ